MIFPQLTIDLRARPASGVSIASFVFIAVLGLGTHEAAAANSCRWTGTGATNLWSEAANWANCAGGPPQNFDRLEFLNGALRPVNVNDLTNLVVERVLITGRGAAPAFDAWQITGNETVISVIVDVFAIASPTGAGASFTVPIRAGGSMLFISTRPPFVGGGTPGALTVGDVNLGNQPLELLAQTPLTVSGRILGLGVVGIGPAIRITGTNVPVILQRDNPFRGRVEVSGGPRVVAMTNAAFGTASPIDDLIIGGFSALELAPGAVLSEPVALFSGTIVVPPGAAATITGPLTGNGATLALAATSTLTPGGGVNLVGPLTQQDGTLVLTHPVNTISELIVERGTLRPGIANALTGVGRVTLSRGADVATLDLNNFDLTTGSLAGGEGGRIQLGARTLTIAQSADATYTGTIAGAGSVVKGGSATLTLSGAQANSYSGRTTIQSGGLTMAKTSVNATLAGVITVSGGTLTSLRDHQIADAALVDVGTAGTVDLAGRRETIGALAGSGRVLLGDGTLTFGAAGQSTTFTGRIQGISAAEPNMDRLIKVGKGTFTQRGSLELNGRLVVQAGVLSLGGLMRGDVVLRGGRLLGTGAIDPAAGGPPVSQLLVIGGTLEPGLETGGGILDAPSVRVDKGIVRFRIGGAGPGIGYNQLRLANNLVLGATARLVVRRTFAVPKGSRITIVDLAPSRSITGAFAGLPEGATLALDGQPFRISYRGGVDANDVVLTALDGPALPTYYFAEGYVGENLAFFETSRVFIERVHLANPHDTEAPVTLTFTLDTGAQVEAVTVVGPKSQHTVSVDQLPGIAGLSIGVSAVITSDAGLPIGVTRTMNVFPPDEAIAANAAQQTSSNWFFASSHLTVAATPERDAFIALFNPTTQPANVTLTFHGETPFAWTVTVEPSRRLVARLADILGRTGQFDFALSVHSTQPIVAERTAYIGGLADQLEGAYGSEGAVAPASQWFLGRIQYDATELIPDLPAIDIFNPQDAAAVVHVTGFNNLTVRGFTAFVPARSHRRVRVDLEESFGTRGEFSVVVESEVPVVAEASVLSSRSQDLPVLYVPFSSAAVPQAGTSWILAGGEVRRDLGNVSTSITIANPGATATPQAAEVKVTFLRESRPPIVLTLTVGHMSHRGIVPGDLFDAHGERFGVLVESTNGVPIVVDQTIQRGNNVAAVMGVRVQ